VLSRRFSKSSRPTATRRTSPRGRCRLTALPGLRAPPRPLRPRPLRRRPSAQVTRTATCSTSHSRTPSASTAARPTATATVFRTATSTSRRAT
jgi:hypothetical protein